MRAWLIAWLTTCLVLIGSSACQADSEERIALDAFPQDTLKILTTDARVHPITVWLALDDAHREQGLMFVTQLNDAQGMLFLYPFARPVSMWMKNTLIPLDMLFITADGEIRQIENAEPRSLRIIESKRDAVAVLELNGGAAERLGIRPGAHISYRGIGSTTGR